MNTKPLFLATSIAFLCAEAHGLTIDFEDFGNVGANGPVVTNQYAGVVFSSNGSNVNRVTSQAGTGFGQNFICTATAAINCTGETFLTFSLPVSSLRFFAVGSNTAGPTARVDVFVNGALGGTQVVNTNGIFNTPNLVDLSSFTNITSIRIYNITDGGGLGWDNFTFAPVPELSTNVLMLLGLAAVVSSQLHLRARTRR